MAITFILLNDFPRHLQLDWGGMVACKWNGSWKLRGVIGEHNCLPNSNNPIIVSDVEKFQTWIDGCINSWTSTTSCPYKTY
jgi:hypothetical protein